MLNQREISTQVAEMKEAMATSNQTGNESDVSAPKKAKTGRAKAGSSSKKRKDEAFSVNDIIAPLLKKKATSNKTAADPRKKKAAPTKTGVDRSKTEAAETLKKAAETMKESAQVVEESNEARRVLRMTRARARNPKDN